MIFLELLWSFMQIGLFSVGGGMAAMPLIQNQVVTLHGWLSLTEFTDLITIAEMTPGPIAVNSATFVGMRIAGSRRSGRHGGLHLPSCIIVSLLAWLFFRYQNLRVIQGILGGLRPAVVALITSAGVSILLLALWGEGGFTLNVQDINLIALGLFAAAFAVLRIWKVSPILVMTSCGVLGGILYTLAG